MNFKNTVMNTRSTQLLSIKKTNVLSRKDEITVSKDWDGKAWETYLESIEVPCREALLDPHVYDYLCEKLRFPFFQAIDDTTSTSLSTEMGQLLLNLTAMEFTVIRLIFWKEKTERAVADQLGLSRSTIQDTKKRALKRIKRILKGDTSKKHIVGSLSKVEGTKWMAKNHETNSGSNKAC